MDKCYKTFVTAAALGEVGYTEKKSIKDIFKKIDGAGTNNYTKYSWYFDNEMQNFYNGKKQGAPWCDQFVDYCFCKAFGVPNALRLLCQHEKSSGAGCLYSMRYYIKAGQFFYEPQTGDQLFFGKKGDTSGASHTGIVVKADGKRVYTVEGNKNNAVRQCSYKLTDKTIIGYGRPDYDPLPLPSALPTLKKGSKGESVRYLQSALITLGYSCGTCGVDGSFGSATLAAVKAFQKNHRLNVDGVFGIKTWSELHRSLS